MASSGFVVVNGFWWHSVGFWWIFIFFVYFSIFRGVRLDTTSMRDGEGPVARRAT